MNSSLSKKIIDTGRSFIGTPYTFGAPSGRSDTFDCSSFVQYVYAQHGILLPRTSRQQYLTGKPIPLDSVRKGDLLFFTTSKRKNLKGNAKIGHVAIFIGNNTMLHTSRVEKKVSLAPLSNQWKKRISGVRRVIAL
ncbi:Gamma-D-glutamyl-L-lysine endopeptidase [Bacillus sp. THAF10]|uniref:C40 family peptidase n=1 Tax=Bacillus sp. THAF10 TaxID=2587848 RepID=UPI001267C37A|nr:C40 family peptidase [Bacillus sp. THAF10]QFT87825.1 Gamma-D-glutamyl-L-lysine endopeptidase [Bacillus sp. THAF10]